MMIVQLLEKGISNKCIVSTLKRFQLAFILLNLKNKNTHLVWRIRFSLLFLYNCYKIVFIYFCFFVFMYTRRRRAIKILSLKCTNVTGRARLLCGKRVITLYHTSTCTIGLPTVYVACAWRAGRSLVFFFDRFMEIE